MNLTKQQALESQDQNNFIRQHIGKPNPYAVRRHQYLKERGVDGVRSRRTRFKKKAITKKIKYDGGFWHDEENNRTAWFKKQKKNTAATKRRYNKRR